MARFMLHHEHEPGECGAAFAAFKGHATPLRNNPTVASCRTGGHAIWWLVEAGSAQAALAQLPFFVAQRATATQVSTITIP